MSFAPALPPLPQDFNQQPQRRQESKPPLPPLPPNFHPEEPLAAPTPERFLPTLPADMARTLDESLGYGATPSRSSSLYPTSPYPGGDPYRRPSPAPPPPGAAYPGGFARPTSAFGNPSYGGPPPRTGPAAPYPNTSPGFPSGPGPGYGSPGQGYASPPPPQSPYSLNGAMSGLSINHPPPRSTSAQPYPYSHQPPPQQHQPPPQQQQHYPPPQQQQYPHSPPAQQQYPQSPPAQQQYPHSPPAPTSPNPRPGAPDLTAPLPTLDALTAAHRAFPHPTPEQIPWVRDVLFLVDRTVAQSAPGGAPPDGALALPDPALRRLAHDAVAALLAVLTASPSTTAPLPPLLAEAFYLRGTLHSTGAFPEQVVRSPRDAFRDFETAARGGYQKAWFKLGRDYEAVGDITRAKDCFERGVRGSVESCYYRMGMARLLGQLGLPAAPGEALPLLHRAATLASADVPQPAYVYGLLLLGEFSHVRVEERMFGTLIPPGSSPLLEARKFVERAAFLGFAPAQYKLGHAYEYAVPPFPFDPLLSVQYYSLASQQGEPEADMALSKWFLCGAEGAFEKDEALALTFAEKAARKGLGSAEFAMGYYAEVGVGGRKDMDRARKWYAKAVEHGNADAPDRLKALSQPSPQALSRTEHDHITDTKLVRKHTQAKMSAAAAGRHAQTLAAAQVSEIQSQAQVAAQPAPAQSYVAQPAPAQAQSYTAPPAQSQAQSYAAPTQAQSYAAQQAPHVSPAPHGRGYSLSDAPPVAVGGGALTPPVGAGTPPGGRAAGRPPGRRHEGAGSPGLQHPHSPALPPPAPAKKPSTGPATFAEMGFQSGKAEDKECVVM